MVDLILTQHRTWLTPDSTISKLTIEGQHECFILEDVVRPAGIKVLGKTAIPPGRYEVVITFSNRFQKPLPLLLRVPNFEGIRIHPGNTAADTEGCLLPGTTRAINSVGGSRSAWAKIFAKIKAAAKVGKVWIEIA